MGNPPVFVVYANSIIHKGFLFLFRFLNFTAFLESPQDIIQSRVPGFGKSTLVKNLSNQLVGSIPFFEGDYNPIDLAWCSYLNEDEYNGLLNRFDKLKPEIIRNKYKEANMYIVTYTKIRAEESFYREFEQYEIYSGRKSFEALNQIVYKRLSYYNDDNGIFECALFQNIIDELILYKCFDHHQILNFYKEFSGVLHKKNIFIVYIMNNDMENNLKTVINERVNEQGDKAWFNSVRDYINASNYGIASPIMSEDDLIDYYINRQNLELLILHECFKNNHLIVESKNYHLDQIIACVNKLNE